MGTRKVHETCFANTLFGSIEPFLEISECTFVILSIVDRPFTKKLSCSAGVLAARAEEPMTAHQSTSFLLKIVCICTPNQTNQFIGLEGQRWCRRSGQ